MTGGQCLPYTLYHVPCHMQGAPYAEDYSKVPCGCSHTDTQAHMCPGDIKHQVDTEIDDEF